MRCYTVGELMARLGELNLPPDAPVVLSLGALGLEFPVAESATLYHGADPVQCLAIGVHREPALPTREPVAAA